MALRPLIERTRVFSLAVLEFCRRVPNTAEAQEAASQLRRAANSVRSNYRAARIRHDAELIDEATQLTKIFSRSLRTARENTSRMKGLPSS